MDIEEIKEEARREPASAVSVRNWLLTGEALQLAVIIVAIVVSYVKGQAAINENRQAIERQANLIEQFHESLDQLRMNRAATPEASARIGVLESRLAAQEQRLFRIEEKIDLVLARQE